MSKGESLAPNGDDSMMAKTFVKIAAATILIGAVDAYSCTADFENCMSFGITAFVLTDQPGVHKATLDGAGIQNEIPVIVSRDKTGFYHVQLGKVAARGGNVQITAFDKNAYCQIVSWSGGVVNVKCYGPDAQPIDSRFSLLFKKDVWDKNITLDYRLASDPGYALKAQSVAWGREGSARIVRKGVGSFFASYRTKHPRRASLQVTALGADPAYCNVMDWSDRGISVQCFSIKDHQPINSGFTLLHTDWSSDDVVWQNNPADKEYMFVGNPDSSNPHDGVIIVRQSPGMFHVGLGEPALRDGGNVQVTAYGSDAHCSIKEIDSEGVLVSCFRGTEPADSRFSLLYDRRTHQIY